MQTQKTSISERTSISDRIAHAEAALKSGLLADYAPATSVSGTATKVQLSWGPAMRR
jgi:hypothetical protein